MNKKYRESFDYFNEISNHESEKWENIWCGSIENCDVCSRPMEGELYMIDGPISTSSGAMWGNLCVVCAFKSSPIIRFGKAQLYKKSVEGRWVLVSGGPPPNLFPVND